MPLRLLALALVTLLAAAGAVYALTRGGSASSAREGAVTVWAVGDGGTGTAQAKAVAARIAADDPDRVLYLGDVYETGSAADFRDRFATVYGELVKKMEPTPGNHEWPNRTVGYDPYWRKVRGRPLPHHYALSLGGWRVLSLNSEDPANPEQLAFVRRELFRLTGDCVLPFWHRPRFNAGEHQEEEADIEPLWREVRGRAPLILSGHDHNLQRFRPVDGTVQYVAGAGGRERYAVDMDDPRLAWAEDDLDGALRIELAPGVARLSFVAANGEVLDRTTVRCRRG